MLECTTAKIQQGIAGVKETAQENYMNVGVAVVATAVALLGAKYMNVDVLNVNLSALRLDSTLAGSALAGTGGFLGLAAGDSFAKDKMQNDTIKVAVFAFAAFAAATAVSMFGSATLATAGVSKLAMETAYAIGASTAILYAIAHFVTKKDTRTEDEVKKLTDKEIAAMSAKTQFKDEAAQKAFNAKKKAVDETVAQAKKEVEEAGYKWNSTIYFALESFDVDAYSKHNDAVKLPKKD